MAIDRIRLALIRKRGDGMKKGQKEEKQKRKRRKEERKEGKEGSGKKGWC